MDLLKFTFKAGVCLYDMLIDQTQLLGEEEKQEQKTIQIQEKNEKKESQDKEIENKSTNFNSQNLEKTDIIEKMCEEENIKELVVNEDDLSDQMKSSQIAEKKEGDST